MTAHPRGPAPDPLPTEQSSVAVAGAGLTGCLLAVRLAKAGHQVSLYDRRPDLRVNDVDAGKSINLAISTRGLTPCRTSASTTSSASGPSPCPAA